MALLAESLVEEWLNREGFFTIRGVKTGVDEIDLLGVRLVGESPKALHVESQVSFRPVGYVTPLPKQFAKDAKKARTSAWERPTDVLKASVNEWVEKKFKSKKKREARSRLGPHLTWDLALVHAIVREEKELKLIEEQGIRLIPFYSILQVLCTASEELAFKGGAGTDIAEMIGYFDQCSQFDPKRNIFMQD